MFREENHLQVREKVINHIMAVNADHRHPLHAKYIFLIRDVMLETVDNLVERLRKVGTVEGWGGK